jgi:CRISPR-associated protein Csx17
LEGERVTAIVFTGATPASLGDLLKGYGLIATLGTVHRDTSFWWSDASHLVADPGSDLDKTAIVGAVREALPEWAFQVGESFQKQRANERKNVVGGPSPLESAAGGDTLSEELADLARSVAVFTGGQSRGRPHPLFPGFGQDGSANYFKTLQTEAKKLSKAGKSKKGGPGDLDASLFGGGQQITRVLGGTGGLYFPGAIKRYATGSSWVHEKDAAISGWDFLLAIRGALLLRGAVRGFRGSRQSYSSFPFVFRGSPVKAGGKLFIVDEIFLPTWSEDRPRTLAELRMQIRQFQARVGGGELASTAADFRRAVQGRGVAGGFDRFHRFVLERRKPGQRQPAVQAVARGATVVGEGATDLRVLLARLDESGWLDQIEQAHIPTKKRDEQLLLAAREVHDAIHASSDDPTAERHAAVLAALSKANRLLLTRAETKRARPLPPLPARRWEKVLADVIDELPEVRVARALASIGWGGLDPRTRQWRRGQPWPIARQILPVEYRPARQMDCFVPDPQPPPRVPWRGMRPEHEFGRVFWRRWLDAAHQEEGDSLPYSATRFAPLEDVLMLLRGELDLREVHRYFAAFLILDWSSLTAASTTPPAARGPAPTAYAILRLWLDAGIHPPEGSRPGRDGAVAQSLISAEPDAILSACRGAVARLRVVGLPHRRSESENRRAGQAVARVVPICPPEQARRMPLAVLVPISSFDTEQLARRLWIPASEDEQEAEASHVGT